MRLTRFLCHSRENGNPVLKQYNVVSGVPLPALFRVLTVVTPTKGNFIQPNDA